MARAHAAAEPTKVEFEAAKADAKIKGVALVKADKWKKNKDMIALAVAQSEWEVSFDRAKQADCGWVHHKNLLSQAKNRLASAIRYANKQLTKQVVAEAERRRK